MTAFDDYKKALQDSLKKKKSTVELDVLSDHFSSVVTSWLPTGCLALDAVIGKGIPVGRIVEIYGDESTGKSLVAEHIAAEALDLEHFVIYADSEAAISVPMIEAVGVDITKLLYFIPETMEDVLQTFETAIDAKSDDSDEILVLIWDSVAASATKAEMEKAIGDVTVATQARLLSSALRRLSTKISKRKVVMIFINQTREKIGIMFGSSVATSGGKALKFYSSVRIELSSQGKITKDKKNVIGVNFRAYVTKNKVSRPFRYCTVPVLFDHGIDDAGATLDYLKDEGIVTTSGSWHDCEALGLESKFQTKDWMKIYEENFDKIVELMGL